MTNKHNIKTIEQILEVVNIGNVENFKKDFCSWLDFQIGTAAVLKELKVVNDIEEVVKDSRVFHWIDDGKNDIEINIILCQKK